MNVKNYVLAALGAAIIAVLAQVSIPVPPVPFTGQTLAIGLVATILGSRLGTLSVGVYLLIGAVGVPVFANFSGGFAKLVGPTGGYLIGFLPAAYLTGLYLEKTSYTYVQAAVANIIGMFVALIFGTIWLKISGDLSWTAAMAGGMTPFIPLGLVKAALATWLGIYVRNRLMQAKLLLATN
ncbi:biotin transporter BioY [Metasolibacillus sp.]|uniref:biotin transporter BioY n=1 Tax=Metasolibacillus sp. TaxID=2703680 RepID=UPI0025D1DAD0|nr:biotin transporter BioY [Metasolibacillus sp.]MCT6922625.1 biotin transporter BioY [Metasolibacillus sp.]MCT6939036.1 biotin transporter BioY [Metasolibacillus sp.]